jgi:excisionase family DNA binding protein
MTYTNQQPHLKPAPNPIFKSIQSSTTPLNHTTAMSTNSIPNTTTSTSLNHQTIDQHLADPHDPRPSAAQPTKRHSPAALRPPPTDGTTPLMSAETLATMLGVSKRTIWRLLSGKQLPEPIRIGGSVRWRRDQIDRWIESGCPVNQRQLFQ